MGLLSWLASRRQPKETQLDKEIRQSVASIFVASGDSASPSGAAEASALYMACVDCHCRHLGKVRFAVYRDSEPITGDELANKRYLREILELRPNPHMSASQLWRAMWRDYFLGGVAMARLEFDYSQETVPLRAIWPVDMSLNGSIKVSELKDGSLAFTVMDSSGRSVSVPESEMLIMVRHPTTANSLGTAGTGAVNPLSGTLKALDANRRGLVTAIESSHLVRFILNAATNLREEDKRKMAQAIANQFSNSTSGVVVTGGAETLTPVQSTAKYAASDEVKDLVEEVYAYQGVAPEVVSGKYTEDQFRAYWESTLEPALDELAEQLSLKVLTARERGHGERIGVLVNDLQAISYSTRIKLAEELTKLPIIKTNQVLQVLGLDPVEGGDEPVQNLNYVKASEAGTYQGTGGGGGDGGTDPPGDKGKEETIPKGGDDG